MVGTGRLNWTKTLGKVVKALRTSHEAEVPLQLIVDEIGERFGCQSCAIILRDEKSEHFRIRHHFGLSHTFAKSFLRPFEVGSFQKLMWTGQPLIVEDARREPALEVEIRLDKPFGAGAILRIQANHSRLGYLHLDFREPRQFAREELDFLQLLADLAGVAILKTRLHEENLKLNPYDPDTGLLSYSHFLAKLESYLVHAKLLKENFAVIIFDIDHYRDLVNVYGSQQAHSVFQKICSLISSAVSPFDAGSRYGVDEVILFLSNTSPGDARSFADRIRSQVAESQFPGVEMQVTLSGGVAVFPHHGADLHTLIGKASLALFETQHVQRNAVYLFNTSEGMLGTEETKDEEFGIPLQ
jgi:diguanylate cyclase (GGDEF)-like protein